MPSVDVVIPVLNEERALTGSVETLHAFLAEEMPQYTCRIVVADNGSTDSTLAVAQQLSSKYSDVTYIHLPVRGRGRALRKALLESDADILSYMDVDLSTDLHAFPKLVDLIEEGYDIAIGSRLLPQSQIQRSPRREVVSRGYNLLIKAMFLARFSDAQCGFKAISRQAAQELLPLVKDNGWFFDSELLIIAERLGYRIGEVAVRWVEDADTRVNILKTASGDLWGLLRLRFGGLRKVSRR